MQDPVLVVGLGGAGCKLAINVKSRLACDCLLISHDPRDLNDESSKILINTSPILNPSAYLIRGVSMGARGSVTERMEPYSTIVIIANLAGKSGAALAPIVSQIGKELGKKSI